VANPGCYTTCSILALLPALKNSLVRSSGIVIDAKSGVSGAGRKESLAYAFCETDGNFKAYSAIRHRHTSEIEEQLSLVSGENITLLFTPHLLPVKRGILATVYTELMPGVTTQKVEEAYRAQYAKEPFVHILPAGELPELKHVVGSNNIHIGFDISPRTNRLVIVACLDNLIKGAGGQAVQNFNIMNGLEEKMGLPDVAWYL
jgi:N-acetyl-gamma-glutamyl-phosphate reductase